MADRGEIRAPEERNRVIVRRGQLDATAVEDGDAIEIVPPLHANPDAVVDRQA